MVSKSQNNQDDRADNTKRDRVGINAGSRTDSWEGSSCDDRRSSGNAPVKCQQIEVPDKPDLHANLAEWGAPHQRGGSKEPPPCPHLPRRSLEF